jgi:hypothetical protein
MSDIILNVTTLQHEKEFPISKKPFSMQNSKFSFRASGALA